MKIKKILAMFMAAVSISSNIASAEVYYDVTYPWTDEIFRVDLPTMYGDVENTGEDVTSEEKILLALGIMAKDDWGEFNPDGELTRADFEAAVKAASTGVAADFAYYNETYYGQKVYQKEIAAKMLSFIESVEINPDEIDVGEYVKTSGIWGNMNYSAMKTMTRREFSEILWNTLNSNYVNISYNGSGIDATIEEDKTILKDKLGVYKIKGTLNAVSGLNIYSAVSPNEGYVEIDRVRYAANDMPGLESLLGYTVEGYVRFDEDMAESDILILDKYKKAETVSINLKDYESMDNTYIYYEEDRKSKKVKISGLKYITYNGDFTNTLTEDMLDANGSIVIGKSEINGEYDIAFIKEYSNYFTKRYVSEGRKLYLSFDAKYKNEDFIDLEKDDGNVIFTLDGVEKSIDDLAPNLSISVIQNTAKSYTEIIASKKSISGKVTGYDEDKVMIDGVEYTVDSYYKELSENTSSGAGFVENGSTGIFYYTADNVIVNYTPEGTAEFGLLKKAWVDEETEAVFVKMFNQSGEWKIYETVERTEVDGVKAEGEDIVTKIKLGLTDDNTPSPVRFILKDEKIKFIDTIYDAPEEANDMERMKEAAEFNGNSSWVKGWDMGISGKAHVSDSTPMFVIPTKTEREQDYYYVTGSAIPTEGSASYKAYNADKFKCARLAVYYGDLSSSSATGWTFIYIKRVSERLVEDEIVEGIECYQLTRGKVEIDEKFYELPEDWQKKFGIDNLEGCFIGAKFSGDTVSSLSNLSAPYVKQNKIAGNYGENFFYRDTGNAWDWVSGTVIDVDVSRKYMLLDIGNGETESVVFAAYTIAKTDAKDSKHRAEGIDVNDINPGDRIFYWGSLRRAYCSLVIENYEDAAE